METEIKKLTGENLDHLKSLFRWTVSWPMKTQLVSSVTGGETTQLSRLTLDQYNELVSILEEKNGAMNRMKQKIWNLSFQIGWSGKWPKIDGWAKARSSAKRPVRQQTKEQLVTTVYQFEEMVNKKLGLKKSK